MLAMILAFALAMGSLAGSQNTTASVTNTSTPCFGSPLCQINFNTTDKPLEKLNVTTLATIPQETTQEHREGHHPETTRKDEVHPSNNALEDEVHSPKATLEAKEVHLPQTTTEASKNHLPKTTPGTEEVHLSQTTPEDEAHPRTTTPELTEVHVSNTTPEAKEAVSSLVPSVPAPTETAEVLSSTTPGTVPPKTEATIDVVKCLGGQDCDLANALQEKSFVLGTLESKQWKQVLAMRLYTLLLKRNIPFPGHIDKLFPGRSAESESNTLEDNIEVPTLKTQRKSPKLRRRHHGHKKRRHRKRNRKTHRARGSPHSNAQYNNRNNRHRKARSVSQTFPTSLGDTPGWINIFSQEITKQHRGSKKRKVGRRNRQRKYRLNRTSRKGRQFADALPEDNGDIPVPKTPFTVDIESDKGVHEPSSDSKQSSDLNATGKKVSQAGTTKSSSLDSRTLNHKIKGSLSEDFSTGDRDYGVNEIVTTRLGKNAGKMKSWRKSTSLKRNRSNKLSRRRRKFRDRQPFLRWRWPRRVLPRALRRRKGRTAVQI